MLLQQFQAHLRTEYPFIKPAQKFLLAVSGGIDSVVLSHLFFTSGFDFSIAHCNFLLRDDESIRDELFVRELAKNYDKKIFVKRFDTKEYAVERKISTQEAARELRYEWFEELLQEMNGSLTGEQPHNNFLVTAHNADDNIETILMFLFRGTGIHGLTGIKNFDKGRKIIRPLLFATRNDIDLYAKENNICWVEDSSNSTNKYTRNFFRRKIIPAVQEQYPNTKKNLFDNIKRFKEAEELYNHAIDLYKKQLLKVNGNEVQVPILLLQKSKPLDTIIWEIIKPYNFHAHQVDEIKKLFVAGNSSYVASSTHKIIRNRKWLVIAPNEKNEAGHILIEADDTTVEFAAGVLKFEKHTIENTGNSKDNFHLPTANHIACLDTKHIQYPLLLRKWKQGDYFYPLGMQKKKKLNRFFTDKKLSPTQKENIWVVEMDKKIIWVIGLRIDDRFKIAANTKETLEIKFEADKNF